MGTLHWKPPLLLSIVICFVHGALSKEGAPYYGRLIGSFVSQYHDISGDVYAVDARTLFIKNFNYDGKAKDAVFFGGTSPRAGPDGFVIPVESGGSDGLTRSYEREDLTLTLPEGRTLKDLRWFAIWSRPYSAILSEVKIPVGFEYPRPQRLGSLSGEHKVSSDRIYIVDAQTFLVPNFTYDGGAPDAFFWVGKGVKPSRDGIKVPDENGGAEPLRRYDTKTLVLTLPGDLTVFDIDWMGIWCQEFYVDFGHVRIPKNLNVPPSLKMLGIAPQAKLNCEVLWDELALEVRWAVAGETIVLQLVGKLDDKQYVSFGPSGDPKRSRMTGGDVAIGWLDRSTGKGYVQDYFMSYKSQCSGERGVCADSNLPGGSNNVRLLNAALVNDYVMLTYQRPLKATDEHDRPIITNGTQAVIWSIGPLNSKNEPSYHVLHNRGDLLLDFGRTPQWNCPAPEELPSSVSKPTELVPYEDSDHPSQHPKASVPAPPAKSVRPWYIPAIECYEPENRVFYAHIGPNGGAQGYNSITKHVGWGISWYINGLLIPEVTVVRGQTYTFVVEGGQDPERPARYHPFYITDDPEGGYEYKTPAERSRVRVLAGIGYDREGNPNPTAAGRLCEWMEDPAHPADSFASFGAYQRTLKLNCEEGQPAILQWTPDEDTPDTVYYQCYTHRYLGWKIRVIDSCDVGKTRKSLDTSASETHSADSHNPNRETEKEGITLREGNDYEQEYYDDGYPSEDRPNPAVRNDEGDFTKDQGFFPPSGFPKFPSGFDDLLKEQESPFQLNSKEELPFGQKTRFPNTFARDPQSVQAPLQKNQDQQNPKEQIRQNQQPVTGKQPSFFDSENTDKFPTLYKDQTNQNRLRPASPSGPQFDVRPPQQQNNRLPEAPKRPPPEQRRPPPQLQQKLPETPNTRNHFQNNALPPQSPALPLRPPAGRVPLGQPNPTQYSSSFDPLQLPPAENKGFNPGSIIWETGFKPLKSSSGPVPPLGFEVEADASEKQTLSNNHAPYYADTRTPGLVTLDPVFVPSEREAFNISALQNHLAVPLPVPIVPVVPGPPTIKQQPVPPRQGPPQRPKQQHPQQQHPQQQHPQQPPFNRNPPPQRQTRPPAPSLEAHQESGIKIPGLSLLKFMNSQRRKQQSQPQGPQGPVHSSPGRQPHVGHQQQPQGTQFNIRQQQLHVQQKTDLARLPTGQNRPQQKQGPVELNPSRQGPQGQSQSRPGNQQVRPAHEFKDQRTVQQEQQLHQGQKLERPHPNAAHPDKNQVNPASPPRKPDQAPGRVPPQNIQNPQFSRPALSEPQRPRQPLFPAGTGPLNNPGTSAEKQRPNKQPSFFSFEGISRFMGFDRRTQKVTDKSQEAEEGALAPQRAPPRPKFPARPFPPQESPNRKKIGNFQGPFPQLPAKPKVKPQPKIQQGGPQGPLQGPPRPIKPAIPLDPISASIINGGSIMGMTPGAVKQTITAEEKAHLEKMLFGPSENTLKRMGEYPSDRDEAEELDDDDIYDDQDSSEPLQETPRVSSVEQDGLVFAESPSVGFKASREVSNSTDLTILTDVWSNIKTESEKQTEEHSEVPESEEFRLVDRMERKLSRKKKSSSADDVNEDQVKTATDIDQRMLDEVSKLQLEHRGLDEEAHIEGQENSATGFNYASYVTVLLPSLLYLILS